ncbi:MAG: sialidase family protein, partial [bacterium]
LRLPLVESDTVRLFVSADLLSASLAGDTVGLGVLDPSDVQISNLDTLTGFPWASAEATITVDWTEPAAFSFVPDTGFRQNAALDDAGHVYVVYNGDPGGDFDILIRRSSDGGLTWGNEENIVSDGSNEFFPDVVVGPSNAVGVAYYSTRDGQREEYMLTSSDFGDTWGPQVRATTNDGDSRVCDLLYANDTLQMAWFDSTPGNNQILYQTSPDFGQTWNPAVQVSTTTGDRSAVNPRLAAAGATIYCVWNEYLGDFQDAGNGAQVAYSYLPDGGAWATPITLANVGASYAATIAGTSDGRAYVAYQSNETGDYQIWMKSVKDGAIQGLEQVTSALFAAGPSLQWSPSGRIDLLYQSAVDSGSSNIFHITRPTDFDAWSTPKDISKNTTTFSQAPVLLRNFASGNMHAFWEDGRTGNTNIWYSQWIES